MERSPSVIGTPLSFGFLTVVLACNRSEVTDSTHCGRRRHETQSMQPTTFQAGGRTCVAHHSTASSTHVESFRLCLSSAVCLSVWPKFKEPLLCPLPPRTVQTVPSSLVIHPSESSSARCPTPGWPALPVHQPPADGETHSFCLFLLSKVCSVKPLCTQRPRPNAHDRHLSCALSCPVEKELPGGGHT